MRYGVCSEIKDAAILADAGYDYIELAVSRDLAPETSETDWQEKRRLIEAMPIKPETFNLFVGGPKIIGGEVDFERLTRYVNTALERARQVGGAIIVFGSGGARRIPDGFPIETANRQMTDFLNLCAEAGDRTGVVIAIEHLNKSECNFINSVRDGAAWARQIGRSGVKNLADTYHIEKDGESLDLIVETADVLIHAHTADTNRFAPGTGAFDYAALFNLLKMANYDARLSIECSWQNNLANQAAPSLAVLKAAASQIA